MSHRATWMTAATAAFALAFPQPAAAQHMAHFHHQQQMLYHHMLQQQMLYHHMLQQQMLHQHMLQQQAMHAHQQRLFAQQQAMARHWKPGQVLGYSFSRDKHGRLMKTPQYVQSFNPRTNTLEVGPPKQLKNVKYLGDPQSTRKLPDGSLLYLWNLAGFGFKPGQTANVHPHYLVPAGATAVISGQTAIGKDPYLFVFIPIRPLSPQQLVNDLHAGLGNKGPVAVGGR